MIVILLTIIIAIVWFVVAKKKNNEQPQVQMQMPMHRKNKYSTAYFLVSLLLILLLIFLPINRGGHVVNTIECIKNINTPYGNGLFWFLFGSELALIIGLILNSCKNSILVKCVRVLLNVAVLIAIGCVMLILGGSRCPFKIGPGLYAIMLTSIVNLILAIAMAFSKKRSAQ